MALGLFSSRWVLHALGAVDYGLMSLVGTIIVFLSFLNNVTANSVGRFFSLAIGKDDKEETNKWFNVALLVHTVFPIVLILIGWPIGEWTIHNFFNIPDERINTAIWVYRFSLISGFFGMATAPFIGMFTAKQRIYELSIFGILQVLLMFLLSYSLTYYEGDAWLLYSGGTVLIGVLTCAVQALRAQYLFAECKIDLKRALDTLKIKSLFSFAGWQLFGSFGALLRGHGTSILLNKYFNPISFPHVNASYSIGNSISGYTYTLSAALLGAITPEILASEGRGNRQKMLSQANRASKFGVMLMILFAVPLLIEMEYVLELWLKSPPLLASTFCRGILIMMIIDQLTYGQMVAVNAVGKIAGYQMMLGGFIILTLPIAWIFLVYGYGPTSVCLAFIITAVMLTIGRVIWAKYLTGLSPEKWVRQVFKPCMIVIIIGIAAGYSIKRFSGEESIIRLAEVIAVTFVSWVFLGWFLVADDDEKLYLKHKFLFIIDKMRLMP